MKIWHLHPVNERSAGFNPWRPWYDRVFGQIVRAETEADARRIANNNAGEENYGVDVWLTEAHTVCIELTADGEESLILRDLARA